MDNKSGLRKGKYGNNVLLLAVLIGFCILALIEILYGQAQLKMERERLALAEENNETVQELKEEWHNLKGEPSVGAESVETVGKEQEYSEQPEKTLVNTEGSSGDTSGDISENSPSEPDDRKYDMQIVFMGDSILSGDWGNTSIPNLIGEGCNAKVYNMSIGGTTAALLPDETKGFDDWESISLIGVVNAIMGNIDPGVFDRYETGKVLRECDFDETDYFVIEYGINDFLTGKILQSKYVEDGELPIPSICTYSGAMEYAINMLQNRFPNAKIFIFSPHYCEFFEGNAFVGDSYGYNLGYGTLVEFSRCSEYISLKYAKENVMFYDTMQYSGIDAYTANEYLLDGIHLTEAGRRSYAEHAVYRILKDFYPEE